MNRFTRVLSITLAAAALGGAAHADPFESGAPPPGMAAGPGAHRGAMESHGIRHLLEQLNLTAEQKQRVRAIMDGARPKMQALRQASRANREKLAITPPTDRSYAGYVAQAKADAGAMIDQVSDVWRQVYGVLTPEQRAKVPEVVKAARAERDARREAWKAQHAKPGA